MSRRKKSPAAAVAVSAIVAFTGLAFWVVMGPGKNVPIDEHRKTVQQPEEPTNHNPVTPSWDGSDLQTGTEEMTLKAAVDDLLRGIDSVPQNAVLLEHGKKDGVLTLNFSSEFDSGYGSSAEQAILNGLRALAGQDPEVEELMILVEGQIVETLGHFEIMEPIPVHRSEA